MSLRANQFFYPHWKSIKYRLFTRVYIVLRSKSRESDERIALPKVNISFTVITRKYIRTTNSNIKISFKNVTSFHEMLHNIESRYVSTLLRLLTVDC